MSRLQDFIAGQAEHHIGMAKAFRGLSANMMAISPECAEGFSKAAELHTARADSCVECCKAMMAGAGDDGLEKAAPWPNGFSTIPTSDAPIKAYPRVGAPNTMDTVDVANVPTEFRKLVEFDDEV